MFDELKWTRPYKFTLRRDEPTIPPADVVQTGGAIYLRISPRLARMCELPTSGQIAGHICVVDVKGKVKRGIFIEVGASE
jgi:hypothetical protein